MYYLLQYDPGCEDIALTEQIDCNRVQLHNTKEGRVSTGGQAAIRGYLVQTLIPRAGVSSRRAEPVVFLTRCGGRNSRLGRPRAGSDSRTLGAAFLSLEKEP